MKLTTAYWCLGSNINPQQHIGFAVRQFQQDFTDVVVSNLYRCPAVGFAGDDFLNLALAVQTERTLAELLEYGAQLEQSAGRVRVERGRFDSRTLDVDLVMFGALQGLHEGRVWPSEDIADFAHVLGPLSDIAGDVRHPDCGKTFAVLWAEFAGGRDLLTPIDGVW